MKKEHVHLSDSDRTYLENLVKKGGVPTRTYKRAIALLELDRGRTFTDAAETVGVVIQNHGSGLQRCAGRVWALVAAPVGRQGG